MWAVSHVILLILTTAHARVTTGEQEHNVTKREIDQQIIGGLAVSMPTAVFILIKPDENTIQSCSGTIMSEDIILSAGHCFDIPGSYANATTIVAGVSDLRNYLTGKPHIAQVINVERVTIHPHYRHVDGEPGEKEELVWDLAIIKLSSKMEIKTNPNMEAVKLPPPGIRHAGKKVRVGGWGRYTPNSGLSLIHQAIDVVINPDEKCSDTYDVGEYIPSLMFCAGERGQTTCRGDSGSGALLNWDNKKILLGVLSFGTKGCQTASVFQRVEKSLPWIFRETNLRPAYEVFEDDLLYKEFLDDVDVVAHSPMFKKGAKLYLEENGYSYWGIPVAKGKTLVEGTVADTCEDAGMRAVCAGDSSCKYSSGRCDVVEFETTHHCAQPMYGLSAKVCGSGKYPRQCPQLEGLFNYMNNHGSYGECGTVGGSWCAHGKDFVSGNTATYYAYCRKQN